MPEFRFLIEEIQIAGGNQAARHLGHLKKIMRCQKRWLEVVLQTSNNLKLLKVVQVCTKAVTIVSGCRLKDNRVLGLYSNDPKNKNIEFYHKQGNH